jgi:hypothetical protein
MSSFTEELHPDTIREYIEYDRFADFVDGMNQFPDTDWRIAYQYYKQVRHQGIILDDRWRILFRLLRKNGLSQ